MSAAEKRIMVHDLVTGRTRSQGRYPHAEYWRVLVVVNGQDSDGESVTEQCELIPSERVRCTQMADLTIEHYRSIKDSLETVESATFTLYRLSPRHYAKLKDEQAVVV